MANSESNFNSTGDEESPFFRRFLMRNVSDRCFYIWT